jgi:hypothetical protein
MNNLINCEECDFKQSTEDGELSPVGTLKENGVNYSEITKEQFIGKELK